jgi:hypothetical protein
MHVTQLPQVFILSSLNKEAGLFKLPPAAPRGAVLTILGLTETLMP